MGCKICEGVGLRGSGGYCSCVAGRFLRAKESAEKKATLLQAREAREKENKAIKAEQSKAKQLELPVGEQPKIKEGDWVEHHNIIGVVGTIDDADYKFRAYKEKDGRKVNGATWVPIKGVEPLPLERFDDANNFLVDLALRTNDKKWFKQLTGGVKQ